MLTFNSTYCRRRPGQAGVVGARGFTLIELIMVIVLVGVLAVYAVPRMISSSDLSARGFHDTTLAYLRYAQKTAIAQRRTVCVSFTTSTVTLRIANDAEVFDCSGANGVALNGPDGKVSASVSGAAYDTATVGGVSCLATPASFGFDALGQPVNSSGVAIATAQCMKVVSATNTAIVEAVTGYVHE